MPLHKAKKHLKHKSLVSGNKLKKVKKLPKIRKKKSKKKLGNIFATPSMKI